MKTSFFTDIRLISFLFLFLSASYLPAQTLVVADIDDTLKISHVLNLWDVIDNSSRYQNVFQGMPEILSALARDQQGKIQVTYVSNAPKSLMDYAHRMFVASNGFPLGETYLRENLPVEQHKLVTIQKLIEINHAKQVIFLGDNGEKDPIIYDQLVKNNPGIRFITFIHWVYSVQPSASERGISLRPGQIGFVTAIEVAEVLKEEKFITTGTFNAFMRSQAPKIINDRMDISIGMLAFPSWLDCSDALFFINPPPAESDVRSLMLKYYDLRINRCH